ncbi:MAG TPA: transglutaminase-like domain-containing protein [Phycisphaerales bacterium]|nr:transglutaminase-like domain-containing protein [Phycisphaerales bacterium]
MSKRMKRLGEFAKACVAACAIVVNVLWGASAIGAAPDDATRSDAGSAQGVQWVQTEEEWAVLALSGKKVGHVVTRTWTAGELVKTDSTTTMTFGRVGESARIEMQVSYVETTGGKPISITSMQKTSNQPVRMMVTFGEKTAEVVTEEGERESRKSEPLPSEKWLTPRGVEALMKEKVTSGAKAYSYATIDPSNGLKPGHFQGKLKGKKTIQEGGKDVEVSEWEATSDMMPVTSTEFYDAEGVLIESRMPLGIGELVTRRTTKEEALANAEGGAAEILTPSFVKPDERLPNLDTAKSVTLRVKTKDGKALDLPSAGGQSVQKTDDPSAELVTVQTEEGSEATDAEKGDQAYLRASGPISSDDALVKKLADSAVRTVADEHGVKSDSAKAEAMRMRVFRHISKKDLGTAFASAAETAKTRTGDCSEHAVLLCAMLRSQGIPARVATGLLYVDDGSMTGFFGWHMWTQALIDGKWVDFDATLGPKQRYHVGHILTAATSLADDEPAGELMAVLTLLGNLEITVEKTASSSSTENGGKGS